MKSFIKFLSRNKLYTAIEAVGLSVSLAFVILIGSYVVQQYQVAHENPDWKRIYALGTDKQTGLGRWDKEELEMYIPEVEKVSRIALRQCALIEYGGEMVPVATSSGLDVDEDFFDIFSYLKWVAGSPRDFCTKEGVVISESVANEMLSIAHRQDVSSLIGQSFKIEGEDYVIVGVIQDLEGTFFVHANAIMNIGFSSLIGDETKNFNSVGNNTTLYRIRADVSREEADAKVMDLVRKDYGPSWGEQTDNWHTWRLDEIFWMGVDRSSGMFKTGNRQLVYLLTLVVFLLLLSAIFNYINLSFALSGKRAKEIATRRLLGEERGGILFKIILESVAFTAVCFVAALLLAYLLEPSMNALLGSKEEVISIDMDVRLQVLLTPGYIIAYILTILILGVFCGLVPAWAASRYEPIDVIKGTLRRKNKMVFSKVFIVTQNILAVFLISMALVMEVQMKHMMERPTHSQVDNRYYIDYFATTYDQMKLFKDKVEQLPFVTKVGVGRNLPGIMNMTQSIKLDDGTNFNVRVIPCDSTYFELLGLEIQENFHHPLIHSVWLCERAYRSANLSDSSTLFPRKFGINGAMAEYIGGVVTDFPTQSSAASDWGVQNACVIVTRPEETFFCHGLLIGTIGEDKDYENQILKAYEEYRMEQFGSYDSPWRHGFLRDIYRQQLGQARRTLRLVELFAVLSILIALMGLLAMSTYFADENTMQIAIRKVFGSDVTIEIWHNVKSFMILSGIACVIGIPLAVWAAGLYLERFAYRTENYGWVFPAAIVISTVIAFLSVLWQIIKASRTNPAETLKKE